MNTDFQTYILYYNKFSEKNGECVHGDDARALEFIRLIRIIIVQAPPSLGDETTGGGRLWRKSREKTRRRGSERRSWDRIRFLGLI